MKPIAGRRLADRRLIEAAIPVILCIFAGCASTAKPAAHQEPQAVATPHVVTDLRSIAPSRTPSMGVADPLAAERALRPSEDSVNSGRPYLDMPGGSRLAGRATAPGHETLLNLKAAQFAK